MSIWDSVDDLSEHPLLVIALNTVKEKIKNCLCLSYDICDSDDAPDHKSVLLRLGGRFSLGPNQEELIGPMPEEDLMEDTYADCGAFGIRFNRGLVVSSSAQYNSTGLDDPTTRQYLALLEETTEHELAHLKMHMEKCGGDFSEDGPGTPDGPPWHSESGYAVQKQLRGRAMPGEAHDSILEVSEACADSGFAPPLGLHLAPLANFNDEETNVTFDQRELTEEELRRHMSYPTDFPTDKRKLPAKNNAASKRVKGVDEASGDSKPGAGDGKPASGDSGAGKPASGDSGAGKQASGDSKPGAGDRKQASGDSGAGKQASGDSKPGAGDGKKATGDSAPSPSTPTDRDSGPPPGGHSDKQSCTDQDGKDRDENQRSDVIRDYHGRTGQFCEVSAVFCDENRNERSTFRPSENIYTLVKFKNPTQNDAYVKVGKFTFQRGVGVFMAIDGCTMLNSGCSYGRRIPIIRIPPGEEYTIFRLMSAAPGQFRRKVRLRTPQKPGNYVARVKRPPSFQFPGEFHFTIASD